jgi:hypothetical protein
VSFEGYADAECLNKTKFRCSLSHQQVEFARAEILLIGVAKFPRRSETTANSQADDETDRKGESQSIT